jgi:hypothetical protein
MLLCVVSPLTLFQNHTHEPKQDAITGEDIDEASLADFGFNLQFSSIFLGTRLDIVLRLKDTGDLLLVLSQYNHRVTDADDQTSAWKHLICERLSRLARTSLMKASV